MNPTPESIAFIRAGISPLAYLGEAWARARERYWLFLGVTAVGLLLGGMAPLGILLGPMMCGIYLCYRSQAQGQPVTFDMLFKGFEHFSEALIASLLMMAASLAVVLPLMAVMFILIFAGALGGMAGHTAQDGAAIFGCLVFALVFLVMLAVSALIGVFFTFTFPLILDRGLKGFDAVKLSFQAARANFGGLLLLALVNALLGFAGLLCCYVGAFLILPVTFGAHWICYERVFGIKETDAGQ